MAIITISRGTFAGGQALAELLAGRLGYECVSREVIYDAANEYGIPADRLAAAMEKPPSFWQQLTGERSSYLNYVRAALCERARSGKLVYHGHAGHLLLSGVSHVIRVRIIADTEYRIRSAMERQGLSRDEAISYIKKVDKGRVKWTRFLYGVEWSDASLYDAVLNIHHMGIEGACQIVEEMVRLEGFQPTAESLQAMEDLALTCRVVAALTRNERTASAEVKVEAHEGVVTIKGTTLTEKIMDAIPEVASSVEGVKEVRSTVTVTYLGRISDTYSPSATPRRKPGQ